MSKLSLTLMYTSIFFIGYCVGKCKEETSKNAFATIHKETGKIDIPLISGSDDEPEMIPPALELVAKINLERQQRNLPILDTHAGLLCASQQHAASMAYKGECSHKGPKEPFLEHRTRRCGYPRLSGAELIACQIPTPGKVVERWINSQAHATILLNPTYLKIGCDNTKDYWTCILSK